MNVNLGSDKGRNYARRITKQKTHGLFLSVGLGFSSYEGINHILFRWDGSLTAVPT
jgi:hypothetical protein